MVAFCLNLWYNRKNPKQKGIFRGEGEAALAHFKILHISDLHLSAENKIGTHLPTTVKNLAEHAAKQLKDCYNIIVVLSGDIIDKGIYKSENVQLVEGFFRKLKEEIDPKSKKIIGVQIVPGNHDKDFPKDGERPYEHNLLSFALQNISEFNQREKELRTLLAPAYEKFFELSDAITNILMPPTNEGYNTYTKIEERNTYCVNYIKITDKVKKENDTTVEIDPTYVVFINLDTTLASELHGDEEKGKLIIGNGQINKLREELADVTDAIHDDGSDSVPLVFCVSHHPIDHLSTSRWSENRNTHESQYELFYDALTKEDKFNADFLLNGHVHLRNYGDIVNREHHVSVLTTGIGSPDSKNLAEMPYSHYYSIYAFNGFDNGYLIRMFVSDGEGAFKPDIAPGEMPLYKHLPRYEIPYFKINTTIDDDESRYMLNMAALESSKLLSACMNNFSRRAGYKKTNYTMEIKAQKGIVDYNSLWRKYMRYLLEVFVKNFKAYFDDKICFRIILRAFDRGKEEFQSSMHEASDGDNAPKSIFKWNEKNLIQYAFKMNNPMIYSVNTRFSNFAPIHWDDFLVFTVPTFDIMVETEEKGYERRPGISFGISLKMKNSEEKDKTDIKRKLLLLQYYDIKKTFEDLIKSFWNDCTKYSSDYPNAKKFEPIDIVDYLVENSGTG
jgi:UDP-2,3-diacylglucosamine pyrophosphatase LpxH